MFDLHFHPDWYGLLLAGLIAGSLIASFIAYWLGRLTVNIFRKDVFGSTKNK